MCGATAHNSFMNKCPLKWAGDTNEEDVQEDEQEAEG